jgi:hypothetical protein
VSFLIKVGCQKGGRGEKGRSRNSTSVMKLMEYVNNNRNKNIGKTGNLIEVFIS